MLYISDYKMVCVSFRFIVANKARVLSPLTKEQRKQKIAKQYAAMFDCKEMGEVSQRA